MLRLNKYYTGAPRKKHTTGRNGGNVDWDRLAEGVGYKSPYDMFKDIYAEKPEDYKEGKLSAIKLADNFGLSVPTVCIFLKKLGFDTSCNGDKLRGLYLTVSKVEKIHYPYTSLGFESDREMWNYYASNNYTPKQIREVIYKASGAIFLYKDIKNRLYPAKKRLKSITPTYQR